MLTPSHIEMYCRIKSDPFRLAGFRVDGALIFCEQVEQRLSKLDGYDALVLVMQGCGYSQKEIAKMANLSLSTVVRRCRESNNVIFEEISEALGRRCHMSSGGGMRGRPRKARAQ